MRRLQFSLQHRVTLLLTFASCSAWSLYSPCDPSGRGSTLTHTCGAALPEPVFLRVLASNPRTFNSCEMALASERLGSIVGIHDDYSSINSLDWFSEIGWTTLQHFHKLCWRVYAQTASFFYCFGYVCREHRSFGISRVRPKAYTLVREPLETGPNFILLLPFQSSPRHACFDLGTLQPFMFSILRVSFSALFGY